MVRTALVVLIVACSLAGTVIGAAALQPTSPPQVSESSQATQLDDDHRPAIEMLGLDSPTRSGVSTLGVDVSTTTRMQREEADSAIDRTALTVAFERAEDEQARRELLFEAATDVEIAISNLHSERRDLRRAYLDGEIDASTYLQGRTVLASQAEPLQADLDRIEELAEEVPEFSMRSRVASLKATLVTFRGPVNSRLQSAVRGDQGPAQVYLETSRNGSTLSTIQNGVYVRQAYRSDLRTPDTVTLVGFDDVIQRVEVLYPRFNTSGASGSISTIGPDGTDLTAGGLYQINIQYRQGTVTAYLDGDTQNVFFEVQQFRLAEIEPGPSVTERDNGTRLIVNRSYDGGPLRIATFDNSSGVPTDTVVLVGENRYRTGSDGVVWALAPGGQTSVVAMGERGNASVSVAPTSPPQVDVIPVEE